jgi:hypothetical protein
MLATAFAAVLLAGCSSGRVTPEEARVIARDAYVYGMPLVDNYCIQFMLFTDRGGPNYKGGWNEIHSDAPVEWTAKFRAFLPPKWESPYSWLSADLRTEPLVISLPTVEPERYYSAQFVDGYTHNFAYTGNISTGDAGGPILLAGPGWTGQAPAGIKQVFQSETELALVIFRTELFEIADSANVQRIQAGYQVQPLSQFLGKPAPMPAGGMTWIVPPSPESLRTSPQFFEVLNYALQFCPVHPSERQLRERLARLGIGTKGKLFDVTKVDAATLAAMRTGIGDAWAIADSMKAEYGHIGSYELYGSREELKNDYARRMLGAIVGIYGSSEAKEFDRRIQAARHKSSPK